MEYKEFMEEVERHIKEYLPEEWKNAEISVRQQLKNNGIQLYGMGIRIPGNSVTPQIYLDDAYQLYSKGASKEETLKKIAEQYLKSGKQHRSLAYIILTTKIGKTACLCVR